MKRRSRFLALLVALLPLAGCAAIPTQTYPKPLGPSSSRQPSGEAPEPEKNLDALQIVREFILASASPEGDYAAAKAYLTPDARKSWNTKGTPTIIDNAFNTVPSTGDADLPPDAKQRTVQLLGRNVGRLELADSSFVQQGGDVNEPVRVELVEGQWRISTPPVGVLVTIADFTRNYQRVVLFFYDKDRNVLVPDPRFVVIPPAISIPQRVVELLVKGPSSAMRGALFSELGPDAGINKPTAEANDGALEVDLTRLGDPSPAVRKKIVAQVVRSLAGVTSSRVRVLLDADVISTEKRDWRPADVQSGEALITPTAEERGMVATGGKLLSLPDDAQVKGPAGTGEYNIVSGAQSLDGSQLAVVSRIAPNAVRLRVGPAEDALREVELPAASLTRPTWMPGNTVGQPGTEVWTVADGTNVVRVVRGEGGALSANSVNATELTGFGHIDELRLSRDGTRVAVIVSGKLFIAAVVRGEDSSIALRIPRPQPTSLDGVVTTVDWLAQDVLVAGTSLPNSPVVRLNIDGLKIERYNTSNLTVPVTSIAAAPGRPILALDRTGLWSAGEVGDVWRSNQVKPETTGYVFYPG
ncbi:LpqB family beta-propeller domain-containing protein [Umezawaea endophytica]|uniref:LpqB family beta-propeller domain-containing protein n=1 Tax=Umezawaea endophytica TaxID=1654476 RepID=A0A9X2VS75_9PSEU|nr:LpqB family beta-propeller domain-containing protein [Umezawaea endophytica]MCS7481676.1 LpqB family beta-propeller domain-containing protein [Umezawaea endophytica]